MQPKAAGVIQGVRPFDFHFAWYRLAPLGLFGESKCNARYNRAIPCEGEYMKSEGSCLRHACLFDIWFDQGGYRVYKFKSAMASQVLDKWRRRQFYKWLDALTVKQVEKMLNG